MADFLYSETYQSGCRDNSGCISVCSIFASKLLKFFWLLNEVLPLTVARDTLEVVYLGSITSAPFRGE